MMNLIRSENLKIFTTKVWWAMLLGLVGYVALALIANGVTAAQILDDTSPNRSVRQLAVDIYTSGQFFGVLLAAVLGALLITNEFRHQTATSTFLATPKRINVIIAKFFTAVVWGIIYGFVALLLSLPVGIAFFSGRDFDSQLGEGDVFTAILLNLLAFGIWAIVGLGVGTLFRNQTGAVVTLILTYFVTFALGGVLVVLGITMKSAWIASIYFYLPYGATAVMTSVDQQQLSSGGTVITTAPEWWVGALVVLLYGVVAALIGTLLTTKRDIS